MVDQKLVEVSIIMGSDSDLDVMREAADFLAQMQIPYEVGIVSAHRTPKRLYDYCQKLAERQVKVVIAGAGGAAHLPGMVASMTPLPVIGVPVHSRISMDGWDSILSILQMPPGIPVATVALNGAHNAAVLAVQILGSHCPDARKKVEAYKQGLESKILTKAQELEKLGYQEYLVQQKRPS